MIIEKKLTAEMMTTTMVMECDDVEADQAENEDGEGDDEEVKNFVTVVNLNRKKNRK